MSKKKALVIGINYKGTGNDLNGCINDAINVSAMLKNSFGFKDITMVLEEEATTQNIKQALANFVSDNEPGDILYFHYSGHGSQLRDKSGEETDGLDEIICPIDLDWNTKVITDDDLKAFFNKVPNGVNLTVVMDCCHSGSGLDQVEEYEVQTVATKEITSMAENQQSRFLPPPPEAVEGVCVLPGTKVVRRNRDVNMSSLLICGCEDNQTSADAMVDGTYQGAATASILKAIRETKGDITYRKIVDDMNLFMKLNGFTQRPELNGSSSLYDKKFLSSWIDVSTPEQPVVDVPTVPVPPTTPTLPTGEKIKKNIVPIVIGGALILFAVIVFFMSR